MDNKLLAVKALMALTVLIATSPTINAVESKTGAGRDMAGIFLKIIKNGFEGRRAVVVENWTGRSVRLWCASGNDRIRRNGRDYIDLKDQEAMGWSFNFNVFPGFSGNTLFWCTFCYKNKKRGWNVYSQKWEKWETNGVPSNGLLRWRIIYDSVRWEYAPLKKGWDFASWPSEGSC